MRIYSDWFWKNENSLSLMSTNPLNGRCINEDVDHPGAHLPSFVVCFHKHVQPIGKRVVSMACFLLKTVNDNTPPQGAHYESIEEWVAEHNETVDSPGFEMEFVGADEAEINTALELVRFYLSSSEHAEYDNEYELPNQQAA